MEERTYEDIMKDYLTKTMGLSEKRANSIIKNNKKIIKEEVKDQKHEEKESEKKEAKVRHGTTCFGIVDGKDKPITEW